MFIEYKPDPHIETVFARLLGNLPPGNFYKLGNLTVPYKIDPTFFNINIDEENIGKRHILKSDLGGAKIIFVPEQINNTIGLILEAGEQVISVEVLEDNSNQLISSTIYPIKVSNLGTLTYALALSIAQEWAEVLEFHAYATSSLQLLTFESSINDEVRRLLPYDTTLRLLALKNLVRVKNSNSTTESILSLAGALSDINPAKLTRHLNSVFIEENRTIPNISENISQDLNLWFSSRATGRRAILNKLAINFPGRFTSVEGLDSSILLGKDVEIESADDPQSSNAYIDFEEEEDRSLLVSLNINDINDPNLLSLFFISEIALFVPNYNWLDYHFSHGIDESQYGAPVNWLGNWWNATAYVLEDAVQYNGSSYVAIQAGVGQQPDIAPIYWELLSRNIGLYGDMHWIRDELGSFDKINLVYAIPDYPESRIDEHAFVDKLREITFHYSSIQFRALHGLDPVDSHDREDYEAIIESHLGHAADAGDQLILGKNVGRVQPWVINDHIQDIYNDELVTDYHQGAKIQYNQLDITDLSTPSNEVNRILPDTNIPPVSPSTGDTYVLDGVGTGAWTGYADDDIAIWDGIEWLNAGSSI